MTCIIIVTIITSFIFSILKRFSKMSFCMFLLCLALLPQISTIVNSILGRIKTMSRHLKKNGEDVICHLIKWIMLLCSYPLILSQCLPPSFSCSLWDSFVHSPCVRWARTPRFSWSASQSSCPTCLRLDSIPVSSCISDRYSAHLYIDDTKTHNWDSFLFYFIISEVASTAWICFGNYANTQTLLLLKQIPQKWVTYLCHTS